MKRLLYMMVALISMLFTSMAMAASSADTDSQGIQVGRVYYLEGDLLRYVPETEDWVAMVKDAPFAAEDTLFSGRKGNAEMIVPNGSWVRVGNNTQVQFITLESDLSEIDVAAGMARFYNKGSDTVIKATSPFGYVLADPDTAFDFYVGDNSVEVFAIKGTVNFIPSSGKSKYSVTAGSPSILADMKKISLGNGTTDPSWDRWNVKRDSYWATLKKTGRSSDFLPPDLRYDAAVLDENGTWEQIPYQGRNCWFWHPVGVEAHWSPFTIGIWTDWLGDPTWIPAEPFGYVTHHYGNWVYIKTGWYWAPPVVNIRVDLPFLDIGFFWYPGRVSWIHSNAYVGWVPLAPNETYYSHYRWGGPHHTAVLDDHAPEIKPKDYAYSNRAIIVGRNNFHGVGNYKDVRVKNMNPAIINKYNVAPVMNDKVIENYQKDPERFKYTSAPVNEKPNNAAITRIKQNETKIRQENREQAAVIQKRIEKIQEAKPDRNAKIEAPKATDRMAPAKDINKSKSQVNPQQKEVKASGNKASEAPQGVTGAPEQKVKPAVQPDRVSVPSTPAKQDKTVSRPGEPTPSKSTQQEKTQTQPIQATPSPTQQERPAAQQEKAAEEKSTRQIKPAVQPDRVTLPATPVQQDKTVSRPGQTTPVAQPDQAAPAVAEKSSDGSKKTEAQGTGTKDNKNTKSEKKSSKEDENMGEEEQGQPGRTGGIK